MKKQIFSGVVVAILAVYAFFSGKSSANQQVVDTSGNTTDTSNSGDSSTTADNTSSTTYKDGTYTGPVTNAYFGDMQVQAVISGGKLTDVVFMQYPNERGTTMRISQNSMPTLKNEAIKIQSSKVHIISGATQTSQAFQESLSAALIAAKN